MTRGFADGYKTYDTSSGYGNKRQWKQAFYKTMNKEEAQAILDSEEMGPHELLGVAKNATFDQIKAAFRILIKKWHPDKNPLNLALAEEMSKKIIAAYTILTT